MRFRIFLVDYEDDDTSGNDAEDEGAVSQLHTFGRVGEKPFRIYPVSASTGAGIRSLWEEIKHASLLNSVRFDKEGAYYYRRLLNN